MLGSDADAAGAGAGMPFPAGCASGGAAVPFDLVPGCSSGGMLGSDCKGSDGGVAGLHGAAALPGAFAYRFLSHCLLFASTVSMCSAAIRGVGAPAVLVLMLVVLMVFMMRV